VDVSEEGAAAPGPLAGVGAAVGERFAALGADVTVAGLNTADAPPALSGAARIVEVDITRGDDLEGFLESLPGLDVLVNAAGVIQRGEEYRPDVFGRVVDINLTGTMRACVHARPLLRDSGGCVVNIASMLSFLGGPLVPAYTASKGGVLQLTKSLAVAWAPEGIRVNAVAPGWIRTGLTAELRADPAASDRILDRTPMRRWGEPADVAGAVAFLSGPDARFVTGIVLPVDGGYLAATSRRSRPARPSPSCSRSASTSEPAHRSTHSWLLGTLACAALSGTAVTAMAAGRDGTRVRAGEVIGRAHLGVLNRTVELRRPRVRR
jgi:NAD(P)-dependent dehydrogenase (short-subunit alcohol dehydrogenase family)